MMQACRVFYITDSPLNKSAVYSVFFHPLKMKIDRLAVIGTKKPGRASIPMAERGFVGLFIFTDVRPKIYFTRSGPELTARRIMIPSSARAIAGSIKPSLVTRHCKSFITAECGRIAVFLFHAPFFIWFRAHDQQKQ